MPELQQWLSAVPLLIKHKSLTISYDAEADVLYINFLPLSQADDSELTDDDIILRYKEGSLIGMTVLHAHKR